VQETLQWVTDNENTLCELLKKHRAVLFRGFPLQTAEDFNSFVSAFTTFEDLSYKASLSYAVRIQVTGRVCTANEGKKGGQIFHHELAQTPFWPTKLFFFCEIPAEEGGATAICPSDIVLDHLREKFPTFVKNCEEKKILYTAMLAPDNNTLFGAGRSWKSFFGVSEKEEAEQKMTELGYTWEWQEGGGLRTTTPPLQALLHEDGRSFFFNQIIAQTLGNAKEFTNPGEAVVLDKWLVFEDGTSIDFEAVKYAKQVCEETAIEIAWQAGDVVLLDNLQVMHARRDFEGTRRVLASFVK